MRVRHRMFIPLLAAGAVAATIAGAPIAAADSSTGAEPTCYQSGPGTQCQTPGNVQFNDAPPQFSSIPMGRDRPARRWRRTPVAVQGSSFLRQPSKECIHA